MALYSRNKKNMFTKKPRLKYEKRDATSASLKLVESKLSRAVIIFNFVKTDIAIVASTKNPQKVKKYFISGLKFCRINRKVSFITSPKSRGFASSIFLCAILV